MLKVQKFEFGKHEEIWNSFVEGAKNSTFLFNRHFMDYHKDRFNDHSVLIFDDKGKLIACFPANEQKSDVIVSHSGLTYGGYVLEYELKLPIVLKIFYSILKYYNEQGFSTIKYKAIPRFYNRLPADEIDYCLFLVNAKLIRRDIALVLVRENKIKYAGNIRREAKKALNSGISVQEEKDFTDFWMQVLVPNLMDRFGVEPVHSLEEIKYLTDQFPKNIRLFTAKTEKKEIIAGTVIFETTEVAHCQYISSNNFGRKIGALNLLFVELIDKIYQNKRFFDFGIANENEGKRINQGLLSWKERMGGRSVLHDFYSIDLKNNKLITKILNQ